MRKKIYQAFRERLKQLIITEDGEIAFVKRDRLRELMEKENPPEYAIKHVALWNRQVEFIEEENVFDMPAVFIEFGKIKWRSQTGGVQDADLSIGLHVVTKAVPEDCEGGLLHLDLLDWINRCLYAFTTDNIGSLVRDSSIPCHDHEEILDSTEVFKCMVVDTSAVKDKVKLTTKPNIVIS